MAVSVEQLPAIVRQHWGLISVGGESIRGLVDSKRVEELTNTKTMILQLGDDPRILESSDNRWERVAASFVDFTRHEALNSDLKSIHCKPPTKDEVEHFLRDLDLDDLDLEVVQGCPSRPEDERLSKVITITARNGADIATKIHISPELAKDRRYTTEPGRTNRLQQIALTPDDKHVDTTSGLLVTNKHLLREEMPNYDLVGDEPGELMVYMSRYILNLVRGIHFVNIHPAGDWMPDVGVAEMHQFLSLAQCIPDYIKRVVVDEQDIREFRQRMMASFLINPKLFTNLVIAFDMHAVFPFFNEIVAKYKVFENLDSPLDISELNVLIHSTMGDKYDMSMSALGNVAKMLGIGRFDWEVEEYLY
ncbi:hypothetical protein KBD69_03120 [Candidatus Woesebacteria bacterium]|nr:hypothetical protein [Candidatus Woesebacteria bacterium]